MENQQTQNPQIIIVKNQKSMGVTIILTVLFGPFGMLYSTVTGGIIMLLVNVVIAFITFGFGLFLTWPICIIWAVVATNNYNKNLGVN